MDTSQNFFIGIDAGTTSIKGVLANENGDILAISLCEYILEMRDGRCELDAALYWINTKSVIQTLLTQSNIIPEHVRAISFSSQGETLICVDEHGTPLRKAIVWLDNRTIAEAMEIEKQFGAEEVCFNTGQPQVQPLWPATRVSWLRKHEPSVFGKVHKFLLVEDYLIYKFTGKYVSEETLVSSTLYYSIREKKWWDKMLKFLGITEKELPEVYPSGAVVDYIQEAIAQELRLSAHTRIVTGAYDHVAGALGAGNVAQGSVTETTGTSMAMVVTLDRPIKNFVLKLPMQCHAIPGKFLLLPYGQTAGFVLKWFKDEFCQEEINVLNENGNIYDNLIKQAEAIAPGAEGLIMLPHLMGSGSPEFDAHARGVFAGITPTTTKGHFIRAILEAIAFMINRNLELLKASEIKITEIRALGGGSKSAFWNQIKADVCNLPITTVQGQETAALGAIILAATGAGFFPSIECACEKIVKVNRTFSPDPLRRDLYSSMYDRYVNLSVAFEKYWQQ